MTELRIPPGWRFTIHVPPPVPIEHMPNAFAAVELHDETGQWLTSMHLGEPEFMQPGHVQEVMEFLVDRCRTPRLVKDDRGE